MDVTMIDVTDVDGVEIGEVVTIYGPMANSASGNAVARSIGTVTSDLLCAVAARVRAFTFPNTVEIVRTGAQHVCLPQAAAPYCQHCALRLRYTLEFADRALLRCVTQPYESFAAFFLLLDLEAHGAETPKQFWNWMACDCNFEFTERRFL